MQAPGYELVGCAACGGNAAHELASADDIRAEMEELWAFHQKRLRPRTPPERLTDRVAFSERPPLRLVRCDACGLVYRNPMERGAQVAALYAGDAPSPDVMRALHRTQRESYDAQAARLVRVLERRGSVLEVGSYVGAFLAAARDAGLHAEGVDVNAQVNAFTRTLGFAVHDGTIDDLARIDPQEPALPAHRYDAVAIWNCFDQLPDPRAAAHAAWRLLQPGGVLAIRVPNGEYYARWRRRVARPGGRIARALLAHNNLLSFPYRYGFSPESLGGLLRGAGFRVRWMVGDVLVPTADEFTRPWARAEERALKGALAPAVRSRPEAAPWFEVYAERIAR